MNSIILIAACAVCLDQLFFRGRLASYVVDNLKGPKKKHTGHNAAPHTYEGENETYIEASVENSSSILYDKEIRNKPRTRRTKRNV